MIGWLKKLLAGVEPGPPQPRPPDWNKTLDDLTKENRSLSGDEIRWAREYERDRLRSWARFPKNDEVFEAKHDVQVSCIVHWKGPYSGSAQGVLPKGTRVRVSVTGPDEEPVGVYAAALNAEEIELLLIPEAERKSRQYGGFSLFFSTAQLNRDFMLVPAEA